jgi:hypothetical protein
MLEENNLCSNCADPLPDKSIQTSRMPVKRKWDVWNTDSTFKSVMLETGDKFIMNCPFDGTFPDKSEYY